MNITRKPLIYLASPYSHEDPRIMGMRYAEIRAIVTEIMNEQHSIIPFSPIAYTHPLHFYVDDDFQWYPWDLQFLNRCDGMIVVEQAGWEISKGIEIEMYHCIENSIPFIYAAPENIIDACEEIIKEIQRAQL